MKGDGTDTIDTEYKPSTYSKYNKDNVVYKTNREFTYIVTSSKLDYRDTLIILLKVLTGHTFGQTKIKYKYLCSNDSLQHWEITGLVEDKKEVWLHPPRAKIPELEFGGYLFYKKNKKRWSEVITMSNQWDSLSNLSIKSRYELKQDTDIIYNNVKLKCKTIVSYSKIKYGISRSTLYFNDSLGFVLINGRLFNGKEYTYQLIDVNDPYNSK